MKKILGLFSILLLLLAQEVSAQNKVTELFQVISDSTSTVSQITMAYIDLSWEYMYVSSDSAELFGKMAFQQAEEHHLLALKPEAYNVIGVNKIVLSEFDTAIIILQKGMVSCNEILSEFGQGNEKQKKKIQQRRIGIFANIGNCYYHKSEYEQAISYYLQSARLAHQLDEKWRYKLTSRQAELVWGIAGVLAKSFGYHY
jgi:tetratricopeptide (TPR) repeat protein